MKKILIFLQAFLLTCFATAQEQDPEGTLIDGVVAVVGQNIVKYSDIENAYKDIRMRKGMTNAHENQCNILESMLISKLLIHKGLVDSVEVTDEEVDREVDEWFKYYSRAYGSKEAMLREVGCTSEELHQIWFDMIYNKNLTSRVQANLTANVTVTPREVQAYYDRIPKDSLSGMKIEPEYELAEITLQPTISESERDRVREQLAQLRERIIKGEKFSMLATLYSQDPGSSKKGGETGFFSRGVMVTEFESAAFALKPGEVSPIVETQFGFHIIQLIERRGNLINVRHILLIPQVSAEDLLQARIKLDSIAQQIRLRNITFENAAQQYSNAATKNQGGVMTNQATMNNRFTKDAFTSQYPGISLNAMNVGEISNATQMKDEENKDLYRIVKVNKLIPEHEPNLTDDYDRIYGAALQEKKNKTIMDWAQKQIKNTYIRISDEFKDCQFQINWVK